jgi:hypothetical protein
VDREGLLGKMKETFTECLVLSEYKNSDYATNEDPFQNFRASAQLAGVSVETSILVRLADKLSRIGNLIGKDGGSSPSVLDETITDTIQDAINYLAILKVYMEMK